jgi:ubiquinone/menaquinone biosynthesis C-methylase UbiE
MNSKEICGTKENIEVNKDSFEEYSKKYGYLPSIEVWAKKHGLNVYVAVTEHREIKEPIVYEIKSHGDDCQILDVGCGYGFLMGRINETCPKATVIGADLSRFQLINAKLRGVNGAFVVCCAEFMPFRSNFFDFIVCSEVIEHVGSKKDALSEIERMLQNGGYLCISTDNPLSVYRRILDYVREKTGRTGTVQEEYVPLESLLKVMPKNVRLYKTMFVCPYSLLPSVGPFGLDAVGKMWVRLTKLTQKLPYFGKIFCNKYIVFGIKQKDNI